MTLTLNQTIKIIHIKEQQATTHTPKPPKRWGHHITTLSLATCKTCRKLTVCDTINRPKTCKQKGGKN